MSTKMPPVPPAERSPKGPGSNPDVLGKDAAPKGTSRPTNPDQEGQEGNIRINTTGQGHRQDR